MASTRRSPGKAHRAIARPDFSAPTVAALPARERIVIWSCVIAVVALAWGYLFYLDRQMAAMAHDPAMLREMTTAMSAPWHASDVGFTFLMWVVMMIGMMAAAAMPMLLLFAATQPRPGNGRVRLPVLNFALGYLLVWAGFSALATLAQWGLHEATLLSMDMATASARLSGAILAAAGAYQLTPLKRACLAHCRSPLGFMMTHWHAGNAGALRMGVAHGLYCLGCCWALMGVLFAVGVMNLVWVAALALLVLVEKVSAAGERVAKLSGIALIAAGALMIAGG
jgi:predicted metal-binding membrane protein